MGAVAAGVTARKMRVGVLRGLGRGFRRMLSGLLRGGAVLYWTCLTRRWPRPKELQFFFAGWTLANFIPGRAAMPNSNGTTVAQATVQKAPARRCRGSSETSRRTR